MYSVVSLFILVAVATAEKCCAPDQWEGNEAAVGGYIYMWVKPGIIKEYLSVHYDYTERRSATFLYYVNGDVRAKYKMIVRYGDFGQGYLYAVNLDKKKCWVRKLRRGFPHLCIPDGAKKLASFTYGPKRGGLPVTAYGVEMEHASVVVTVTDKGCVPVTEILTSNRRLVKLMQTINFMDIKPGIANATVFDVPKGCKGETLEEEVTTLMDEFTEKHYVMAI